MPTRLARLAAALTVVLLVLPTASAVAAPSGEAFVAGSGMIREPDRFRNFAFTARRSPNGFVKGQAQLKNRNHAGGATVQGRWHLEIDCLRVEGNVATLSGDIVRGSDPTYVGGTGWFRVIDHGEGPGAPPDEITLVSVWVPGSVGLTCEEENPSALLVPISAGNVQVHEP